ncbi:CcoQ/FixQ family Cbb3-type cytochrome c oxidase assembly chaperone [Pyxidicoccus parkwayensis]|uniref:CcoQ/FixQ family Cbb3-type cytochrome c oxidase assembly chaperone n=1 Tax=Pyxidicoccus parkwayensis TaxID=2813578 RepID=A0ABX7NYW6_9BACT|nr:CcoQ/FixQ family Cbb3-type cytochrome c oxidase assembly chaperone [Pyxidicoccus parkwaysis]QSQ24120.1 CcoQ/FixQ family Cbb3-type cytochrome c oxidase assembly chaperone [Pyxidicoccus parkwaysis]
MYKQFYEGMELTHLPLFALWLFIAVFLGVCVWVFGARRSRDFDALAQMPLSAQGEQGHE